MMVGLGRWTAAALIRVSNGPATILMTIYQSAGGNQPPRLQVTKLVEGMEGAVTSDGNSAAPVTAAAPPKPLLRSRTLKLLPMSSAAATFSPGSANGSGSVAASSGSKGSPWRPAHPASRRRISNIRRCSAVVGFRRGRRDRNIAEAAAWPCPFSACGSACGAEAEKTHTIKVSGTFTDGTKIGPVGPGEACEAESLAPLEAFLVEITPVATAAAAASSREAACQPGAGQTRPQGEARSALRTGAQQVNPGKSPFR